VAQTHMKNVELEDIKVGNVLYFKGKNTSKYKLVRISAITNELDYYKKPYKIIHLRYIENDYHHKINFSAAFYDLYKPTLNFIEKKLKQIGKEFYILRALYSQLKNN